MNIQGKVAIITGSTRGIGKAIALRLAREGVKVVVTGKSVQEGKLPGTIYSVAEEIKSRGGVALPLPLDLRFDESIESMVRKTVEAFGGIDFLINNAGAISLTPVEATPMKKLDLMIHLNVRASLATTFFSLPHMKKRGEGHILNISPPLSLNPKWLSGKTPYTITKYGMTLATLGLAEELKPYRIGVNSLWPKTLISTAATEMLLGAESHLYCRSPEIMADAAYEVVASDPALNTGEQFVDEELLLSRGYTDLEKYKMDPKGQPMSDLFVED